jgi:hypothetical protein
MAPVFCHTPNVHIGDKYYIMSVFIARNKLTVYTERVYHLTTILVTNTVAIGLFVDAAGV